MADADSNFMELSPGSNASTSFRAASEMLYSIYIEHICVHVGNMWTGPEERPEGKSSEL